MTPIAIDWDGAEVRGRELTVALSEPASPRWRERFEQVLAQLDRGTRHRWGAVRAKKRRIVVAAVEEGGEEELRHVLESLVQEANASEPDPHETDGDDADARMASAFRSFGAADSAAR